MLTIFKRDIDEFSTNKAKKYIFNSIILSICDFILTNYVKVKSM